MNELLKRMETLGIKIPRVREALDHGDTIIEIEAYQPYKGDPYRAPNARLHPDDLEGLACVAVAKWLQKNNVFYFIKFDSGREFKKFTTILTQRVGDFESELEALIVTAETKDQH